MYQQQQREAHLRPAERPPCTSRGISGLISHGHSPQTVQRLREGRTACRQTKCELRRWNSRVSVATAVPSQSRKGFQVLQASARG